MIRALRRAAPLALALLLTACQGDVFAAENLGKLRISLDVSGTPAGTQQFVVEWTDLDSPASGSAPFTLSAASQTFDQVPLGPTQAALKELPFNCVSERNTDTTTVVKDETREIRFGIQCR